MRKRTTAPATLTIDSSRSDTLGRRRLTSPPKDVLFSLLLLLGINACSVVSTASAQPTTVPPGLNPGDSYRLVFITEGETSAVSSNIADYNAFVTAEAIAVPELNALDTIWTAIGSTSSVDARDNTDTNPTVGLGYPIYDLGGVLRASDNGDLWNPSANTIIAKTPTGLTLGGFPWTGTEPVGVAAPTNYLGASSVNHGHVALFEPGAWVAAGTGAASGLDHLYAISGPLTVVPEPSSCAIFLAGTGLLLLRKMRW